MSHVNSTVSSQKSAIYSAIASFAGMMAAIPVSLALFSSAQPAQAMQQQSTNGDAAYAQYMKAYTDGYTAGGTGDNGNCAQAQATASESAPETQMATLASSHHKTSKSTHHYQPMSPKVWKKTVKNSYNTYVTNNHNKTYKYTKNINSNNTVNSNNTATSTVNVKGDGASVNSSANVGGVSSTNQNVSNVASNNDVKVEDSFNTDSHDKTVTNTTNNVNSNNDIEVNVGSKNKVKTTNITTEHKHHRI